MAKKQAKAIEHADRRATRAVAAKRDTPVVRTLGWLSEVGDQPQLRALCAATIALALSRRDQRQAMAGVSMLAAHTLATAIKSAVKHQVDRTRPDHAATAGYHMEKGDSDAHALSSFPSGHTAGAVAVAEAFAHSYPEHAGRARLGAAAIAAIQVPRAKHYVGDVLVGALIGWGAERMVRLLTPVADMPQAPDRDRRRSGLSAGPADGIITPFQDERA